MGYSFECPYFCSMRSDVILCEIARVTPPDKESRKEFVSEYCGHTTNYKECPFYKVLDNYYKRLYSTEVDKW